MSALRQLSSFTVSFTVNLEPLYGIIFAFVFLDEHKEVNWGFYAGVGVITLSVLLQTFLMIRNGRKLKKAAMLSQ